MCTKTVPFDDQFEVLNKQEPTLIGNFSIFNNILSGLLEKEPKDRFDLCQIEIELKLIEQKIKIKSYNIHDGNFNVLMKITCINFNGICIFFISV